MIDKQNLVADDKVREVIHDLHQIPFSIYQRQKGHAQSMDEAIRLIRSQQEEIGALKSEKDHILTNAAIAAGNEVVAIAKRTNPKVSLLRLQMLRVKMEKAVLRLRGR